MIWIAVLFLAIGYWKHSSGALKLGKTLLWISAGLFVLYIYLVYKQAKDVNTATA